MDFYVFAFCLWVSCDCIFFLNQTSALLNAVFQLSNKLQYLLNTTEHYLSFHGNGVPLCVMLFPGKCMHIELYCAKL